MSAPNLSGPLGATLSGIRDLFRREPRIGALTSDERLDGKTALVTGASSGLGFATAVHLAQRGAEVIMACRSGIPEAGERVQELSGSRRVQMLRVDLADLDSVDALVEEIVRREVRLDRVILNAAIVPVELRRTPQGLNEMFVVNYLSSFVLLGRLLAAGAIARPGSRAAGEERARIIFVASEAHRSGADLDLDGLDRFPRYSAKSAVAFYGYYKLMLVTFAQELDRRLNPEGEVRVPVHVLCPGAVNTNIIREAPAWLMPLLRVLLRFLFQDPFRADEPVLYLTCARGLEGRTGLYLHRMTEKPLDPRARDPRTGRLLWERTEDLLAALGRVTQPLA